MQCKKAKVDIAQQSVRRACRAVSLNADLHRIMAPNNALVSHITSQQFLKKPQLLPNS